MSDSLLILSPGYSGWENDHPNLDLGGWAGAVGRIGWGVGSSVAKASSAGGGCCPSRVDILQGELPTCGDSEYNVRTTEYRHPMPGGHFLFI